MRPLPTQERVRHLFLYDPESGSLTRRVKAGRAAPADALVGTINKGAYQVRVDGRIYRLHRLVWLYVTGTWPTNLIDHIDGNPLNNSWRNLRDVTNAVNQQNQRRAQNGNGTGFLGVTFNKNCAKFQAQISFRGVHKYLGLFNTAEEAHSVYLAAKRLHHEGCTI